MVAACVSRIALSANVRDELLEHAFERRDAVAYEMAYRRFGPRLRTIALRLLQEPEASSECVQDVFLQLWQRGDYSARRGALEAFLAVCVRNRALMQMRSSARARASLERLKVVPEAYVLEDDPIERVRIEGAISQLTNEQRDVVTLAYYRGLTLVEVAAELAIPLGTVKTRLAAALRALRRSLVESSHGI
jgi:RNA polymerase sigma-70 factor, ECF subfamily